MTINAAPDVRPATTNLWPRREQQRRARRLRSPHPLGKSSPEAVCLGWARTFSEFLQRGGYCPEFPSTWPEGPALLGFMILPEGPSDLKRCNPPYFGADRDIYRFADCEIKQLTLYRLRSLQ